MSHNEVPRSHNLSNHDLRDNLCLEVAPLYDNDILETQN